MSPQGFAERDRVGNRDNDCLGLLQFQPTTASHLRRGQRDI